MTECGDSAATMGATEWALAALAAAKALGVLFGDGLIRSATAARGAALRRRDCEAGVPGFALSSRADRRAVVTL